MKKTGQLLKEKREAARLSISEIALATKINPKILTAIENGDEAMLPAKTILKGFLKSYALYLKTDPEEVLRCYQEEMGGPPPERAHEIPAQPAMDPKEARRRLGDEHSSGMRAIAVICIVVLIGVIIGVRELVEKYQREKVVENSAIKVSPLEGPPAIPETKPGDASAEVTPTTPAPEDAKAAAEAPTPAVAPKGAQNEMFVAPTTPPAPAQPAAKVEETKTPPPAEAKAETKPAAKSEVAVEKPAEKKEEPVNADPAGGKKSLKNEIILEALDKVDVKFQIKGETKRVSLGPTQVHTIHSDQPVTLDLSDGGAVNIILNGRERGVPGDLGKPKQIKIP